MIYVDAATWKKPNGRKAYAHMVADSIEELHEFAAKIGVKPHFFHRSSTRISSRPLLKRARSRSARERFWRKRRTSCRMAGVDAALADMGKS